MVQNPDANVRLVLDGVLTIRTADSVCATLRQAIEAPDGEATSAGSITGLQIDCGQATDIDLTFIQLLIACRSSADRMGKVLTLASEPDGVLLDTLTRAGFEAVRHEAAGKSPAFWFERAFA